MFFDSHHVLTASQMQQADAATIASGTAGFTLMQQAGQGAARWIQKRYAPRPTAIFCGTGNNGGDGYVVAQALDKAGWPVQLIVIGEPTSDDAKQAAAHYEGPRNVSMQGCELVIDAIFGTGLSRPIEGKAAQMIDWINAAHLPVIALDIASGIDATSGVVHGTAIYATHTLSFCRKKRGHLLMPGKEYAGEVTLIPIGISDATIASLDAKCEENHPDIWRAHFPSFDTAHHKYSKGHVAIIGGNEMIGAAKLAATGALRAGAGMASVLCEPSVWPIYAASLTSVMAKPCEQMQIQAHLRDSRINSWLIGPGAGVTPRTRMLAEEILQAQRPTVLDADALSVFAPDAAALRDMIRGPAILTPHEGEFKRLFHAQPWVDDADKCQRAAKAAAWLGAVIILKGPDTVIAAPDGRLIINSDAPPTLATAGSGDVLAGLCAGLIAQTMPAFEAVAAAVWIHGQAAHLAGRGLIAEDLPSKISAVLQRL